MSLLRYETAIPAGARDGAPLLVLLHGRGADRFDLLSLAPHLAPDAIVVTPEAPHPGAAWGYGPGWAWYRFLGGTRPDPDSFETSQRLLGEFLAELTDTLPVRPGPLVLGGFSQGGTMSVAYALRNPGAVPFAVNLSGFLADHPTVAATAETVRGTRFFWGHGTMDDAIPFAMGQQGRAALRAAGAELEERDYAMGHGISPDEARDLRAWIARGVGGAG
ncbi:MAG TPA: alpha/beta fold hydrolase [Longimicrobium sp.]|jgi:phospholipase/carboxylesterase|uniref:alpha/beta hydrolase n=1 Tax=Longimicrobium sp. TaxID=2029185 RepID=UPI002ED9ECDD